jgi:hypothetical protein
LVQKYDGLVKSGKLQGRAGGVGVVVGEGGL